MQPAQSTAIIGHDEAKRQVEEAFAKKRMHHAWLLIGPEGVGKASFAYHVAHTVLSRGENGFSRFNPLHPVAKLVMAESHPDLFVLRRRPDEKTGAIGASISAEDARAIEPFMRLTASHGAGRVAIVDEAHVLTRTAQNAILKIIEEPPPGAVIVLTATTVGSLLPTIRSRCRVLSFAPLPDAQVETVLTRLGVEMPSGEDKRRFLRLANGSVGFALRIAETGVMPLFDEALALMAFMPGIDVPRLHKLADLVGKKADAESFKVLTSLILSALREAVSAVARGDADEARLAERLGGGRLDRALQVWEKTDSAFKTAETANLDNKLAFIAAMTDIAKG